MEASNIEPCHENQNFTTEMKSAYRMHTLNICDKRGSLKDKSQVIIFIGETGFKKNWPEFCLIQLEYWIKTGVHTR
jgi:hypothetical protein